jgi:hypothetical protein
MIMKNIVLVKSELQRKPLNLYEGDFEWNERDTNQYAALPLNNDITRRNLASDL